MLHGEEICDIGLKRKINQDRAALFIDGETALGFVADGIGGHYSGEKASGEIYNALAAWWKKYHEAAVEWSPQELSEHFKALLDACARNLYSATPPEAYCGSTIVLLWVTGRRYLLLSAGDSRCYRVKPEAASFDYRQLSTDDVYHARDDSDKKLNGKLINAVGSNCEAFYSIQTGEMKNGTLFALCSDGIYRYCEPERLERILTDAAKTGELEHAINLSETVVRAGGAPDNYSLVLLLYS